jgi:hypothetical protein
MSMTHNPLMTAPGTSMSVIRRGARRSECPRDKQTASTTQELDRPPTATTPSFQQELAPNVALNVGYHRTWYGGFLATDSLAAKELDV